MQIQDKKIYFITTRKDHRINNDSSIEVIDTTTPLRLFLEAANFNKEFVGYDKETTGLNPFTSHELLDVFGNRDVAYVVDKTCIDTKFVNNYSDITYIGHNIQFDCKFALYNGVHIINTYDTLLVERTLRRGLIPNNTLEETYKRRLGRQYPVAKTTRKDFVGASKNMVFEDRHIYYSASDNFTLFEIKDKQEFHIKNNKLEHYLYNIVFPLSYIISKTELEGIGIDSNAWRKIIEYNKKARYNIELELDSIIKTLSEGNREFIGGKFSNKRKKQEVEQLGFFEAVAPIENSNKHNVNYSSSKQVIEILRKLNNNIVPTMREKNQTLLKPSVSSTACEEFIYEYPESKIRRFLELYIQYNEYSKAINSFGYKFLYPIIKNKSNKNEKGYINPITNKVHTNYKLETTANGRFASGDSKAGTYNSQQIPKEKKYRVCFTLTEQEIKEGYWITTCDLSSAELIILASLSGDIKLLELQAKDVHSHLATASYNKIITYLFNHVTNKDRLYQEFYDLFRVNKIYNSITIKIDENTYRTLNPQEKERLTKDRIDMIMENQYFQVNKKDSSDLRDSFKNVVYGTSYGATAKKVAKTLNIAKDYGQMVLDAMRAEIPDAFRFLDNASNFGIKNGYISFNNITNNRCLFPAALAQINEGIEIGFSERGDIERSCKNYPISGTQADMIKESIVNIFNYSRQNNINNTLLLQVHDELVYKHKDKEFGKTISNIMTDTANKYLNGIAEMKAEYQTLHTWIK